MATPFPQFEGKYEIITKLKEGGMGAVYKVRHRLLDEVRVIKLIRPQLESDEAIRARFLREARTAVRLRHPNIAQFYDFSMDDEGNAFLVMEFIEGITIEELLARVGPPPLPLALVVAEQSLLALGYLHRRSTIHRDISPDNLMLSRDDDGQPLIKLIDLGIAKVLEDEGHSQINRRGLTGTGMFLGKVRYASPEQFHAQEGVTMDARSDLYSFGLVLYELLTGRHPVRGTSVPAFIAGHLFHPPLPFAETDPEGRIPGDLRELVLHSLAKSPDTRIPSAEAFVRALAPIRARFPLTPEQAAVELDGVTAVFTEKTQAGKTGSTQARLDRQFGIAPTPPPTPASVPGPPSLAPSPGSAVVPVTPPPQPRAVDEGDASAARDAPRVGDTRPIPFHQLEEPPPPPPPAAPAGQDTRVLVIPGAGATRAASLVRAARELVEQGRWGEALERLSSALSLDPDNADARALRAQAEQALAAEAERARRASALAAHAGRIEDLLEAGQLEQARLGLESALADVGRDEALDSLLERLAAAESGQADGFSRQAQEALADGDPEGAVTAVQQAIALRPDEDAFRAILKRAEEAIERRRRLASAVAEIELTLQGHDLPATREALDRAQGDLGDDPALGDLRRRLEGAERQAIAAEVARLVALAGKHLAEDRLEDAREAAQRAHELMPLSWEAAAALADTKAAEEKRAAELRAAQERRLAEERAAEERRVAEERAAEEARAAERRLAGQRAEALETIQRQTADGDLPAAQQVLEETRSSLGDWPELAAAEKELERALLRQRAQLVSALLAEARRLRGDEQFDAAEAKLDEAIAISPTDERVLQALVDVRAAGRKHREAQERARAVADEVAAIGTALDAGRLTEAAERFDAAIRKLGDRPELAAMRLRLHEARRTEQERKAAERRAAKAARRQESGAFEDGQTMRIVREEAVPTAEPPAGIQAPAGETRPETRPLTAASIEELTRSAAAAHATVEPPTAEAQPARLSTPTPDAPGPVDVGQLPEPGPAGPDRRETATRTPAGIGEPPAAQPPRHPAAPPPGPKARPAAAAPPPERPEPAVVGPPEPQPAQAPVTVVSGEKPSRRWPLVLAALGVIVAVAIGIGLLRTRPSPAPPAGPTPAATTPRPVAGAQGSLAIVAVPWAEVVAVRGTGGQGIELPAIRITPLRLQVAPGRYVVSLRDPMSGVERSQEVEVTADRTTRVVSELRAVRAGDLLRRYGWSE
ncbi:MAG: protein kinase [Thermoanaerobaculaceae bacterium]|nr:protein kinase [Thermoanaerobaculaceae bacterium]